MSRKIFVNLPAADLDRSRSFSPLPIADATTACGAFFCLSCDSRQEVDELIAKAVAAGGATLEEPQDHGFMYGQSFKDIDGHLWELMWMDAAAFEKQTAA